MPSLSVAILHHPVINRLGDVICSTISEHDVFDASRLSLTYGVDIYIVNHVPAQRELCERLLAHGTNSAARPDARGLFTRTHHAATLDAVVGRLTEAHGTPPHIVSTSAKAHLDDVTFEAVRTKMADDHVLLLVGKAWGLAPEVLAAADARLKPIECGTDYNHLSVRSALAILIDRLCARRP